MSSPAPRTGCRPRNSRVEQNVLARFARETGDVNDLVALLTDDVWLTLPPVPLEYQGRELAG